jgi:Tfp pilus assembly protein PilV
MQCLINQKRSSQGFTIVETLIAVGIFVIVITGFIAFFLNCMFLNETNRHLTLAKSHAQFAMEEVKSTPFNNITSTTWNAAAITLKGLYLLSGESIVIAVTGTDPKDVTVTVNWKDRITRDRSLSLRTIIASP